MDASAGEDRPPLDELAGAGPGVPGAALGLVGLELEQVAAERDLEPCERRLDAVCGVPERRLATSGGRRLRLPPAPALEQADASQARSCTISRRAVSSLVACPTRMSGHSLKPL